LCSLLYSFPVSLFQLVFLRLYALFSEHRLSLSLGRFSLSFFLSQNWWGKPISGMGVLETNLKIVCFACVSLLFGFFHLSPSLQPAPVLRCSSAYIEPGGLVTAVCWGSTIIKAPITETNGRFTTATSLGLYCGKRSLV